MRMIYVNNCALAGGGAHPFLEQERGWLVSHFERVDAVDFRGAFTLTDEPCASYSPRGGGLAALRGFLAAPFSRDLWREMRRLRADGKLSAVRALKLFAFTKRALKMHYWIERALAHAGDEPVTIYSFWMSYDGYAAALSKRKHPAARFVARGHAFDIDVERNPMNPYLMKSAIAEAADGLYPISEAAQAQLLSYLRGRADESKIRVLPMGSGGAPVPVKEPPYLQTGVLHLVSCARVIDIKQLPLLVDVLSRWDGAPIRWTHLGDGEGLEPLRAYAEEKLDRKENVIYSLPGGVTSEEARVFYERNACDLFVNTSRREGVPVTIMEAMRCGVPFVAPSVGGVPELARGGAGFLYDPADGAAGALAALARFAALTPDGMRAMRANAKARWDEHYQSARLLHELFPTAGARR